MVEQNYIGRIIEFDYLPTMADADGQSSGENHGPYISMQFKRGRFKSSEEIILTPESFGDVCVGMVWDGSEEGANSLRQSLKNGKVNLTVKTRHSQF